MEGLVHPPDVVTVLEPVSPRRGPVVFEDSWRGVSEYDDCLVLVSRFLQSSLEPVPLGCRVVVAAVPGHQVGLQVEVGVDGHQLQLPASQVDLVVAAPLESIDGFGREPGLPEVTGCEVQGLLLPGDDTMIQ